MFSLTLARNNTQYLSSVWDGRMQKWCVSALGEDLDGKVINTPQEEQKSENERYPELSLRSQGAMRIPTRANAQLWF